VSKQMTDADWTAVARVFAAIHRRRAKQADPPPEQSANSEQQDPET
jgi:hypothetical protein